MQKWKGGITINNGLASMVVLFLATGTCNAFTAAPIKWRGPLQSSLRVCLQKATPIDVIDAMPSDVTPEFDSMTEGDANTAEPDFALAMAMDLLKVISSSVGDDYIPYSEADKRAIEEMVEELESSAEGNQGTDVKFPRDLSKLDGRWRLIFTNALVGMAKVSPLILKDVYQVVDASSGILTNVAYGTISPPLFAETWGRLGQRLESLAKNVEDVVSFPVDFNIEHDFQVSSQSNPAQIELVQKELKLLNVEDPARRSIALPILQPLAKAAAGRFDTTFLYNDVRISRGRFGEIRVFQRVA